MRPTPAHLSNSLRGVPGKWDAAARTVDAGIAPSPPPDGRNSAGTAPGPQAVLVRPCPLLPAPTRRCDAHLCARTDGGPNVSPGAGVIGETR
jgi:hypothetical protein